MQTKMAFPHDGKKFQPGQSGNPKGRPPRPSIAVYTELLNDPDLNAFPVEWREILQKKFGKGTPMMKAMAVAQIFNAVQNMDTKAHNAVLDRLEGKAEQPIDFDAGDALPQHIDTVTLARQLAFVLQGGVASQSTGNGSPQTDADKQPTEASDDVHRP